ncbi:FxLYD domain-containing protein [Hyphomonas sp.]|uniref:FxLYD domain-containing protein n=1 Tax=Alphaproteobacteria TaxID=28211 RepID=UPI0032657D31
MHDLGNIAVLIGAGAIVIGMVTWTFATYEATGKTIIFGGAAALLFGLPIVLLVPPPRSGAADTSEVAMKAAANSPAPPPSEPDYDMKLGSWRCYSELGFQHIDGLVKNVGDQPLDTVMAVATFLDGKGGMIKTASAMIDFQPIMPGQTSPFKVITTGNPLIRKCVIQMTRMFGGQLLVEH